ncbi:MAG: thiamine pyrophosphate-dependent dehydrogenase E1 component subunit alpha [Firmicutes bacterium]|nr:thiamine pyrophosphate-dependent dehydrogenase E1 component subunit alpha [Bacillota bacterium]
MSKQTAVRHREIGLSDEQVLDMYRTMILARALDERMWLLNRAGKLPFVVSCKGQEGAQVGLAFALDPTRDYVAPYYRDLGVVLRFGQTARDVMLSGFAKREDPNSGGRQMPGHFGSRKNRILTGSSPVSTQIPHAVGMALAARMRNERLVTYTSFGEGSSNQGDFHEACNFAGVQKLPVIFFCENNLYAISVPLARQVGCERIAQRAEGYGFPGVTIDGNDVLAVYEAARTAVNRALDGLGPTLIEVLTYRINPHSSDDDDRVYRSREEVDEAKQRDAIVTFGAYLRSTGVLTADKEQALLRDVEQVVDEATAYAEQAPYAEPQEALGHVYAQ